MHELILQFTFIHNELYTTRKEEVERVIERIVETVTASFYEAVKQIDSFNSFGSEQVLLELEFFKSTLNFYFDDNSSETVKSTVSLLSQFIESERESKERRKKISGEVSYSTRILYECLTFQNKSPQKEDKKAREKEREKEREREREREIQREREREKREEKERSGSSTERDWRERREKKKKDKS